jgi:hypothetical protein
MLYWRKRSEQESGGGSELRLLGEKLAHAAEFFVALVPEFLGA